MLRVALDSSRFMYASSAHRPRLSCRAGSGGGGRLARRCQERRSHGGQGAPCNHSDPAAAPAHRCQPLVVYSGYSRVESTSTDSTLPGNAPERNPRDARTTWASRGLHRVSLLRVHRRSTPLHVAAEHGQVEFAEMLLGHGANVHARRTHDEYARSGLLAPTRATLSSHRSPLG
jgi:hypothetical protein